MGVRLAYFNKPYNYEGNATLHEDHNDLINRDIPKQHPMYAITGLNEVISAIENLLTDHTQRLDGIDTHLALIDDDLLSIHQDITDINNRIDALRTVELTHDTDTISMFYEYSDKSLTSNVKIYDPGNNGWNKIRVVPGLGIYVPGDQYQDTNTVEWEVGLWNEADTLENIFTNGTYFYHNAASSSNVYVDNRSKWTYSDINGFCYADSNSSSPASHEGFVSHTAYGNFVVNATLGSTAADDDGLTFLLYMTDENEQQHTLAVVFSPYRTSSQLTHNCSVCYDYRLPSAINNLYYADPIADNGSYWSYYPNGITINITKQDNMLTIHMSDFNSTAINNTYDITIDLNNDANLQKFSGPVRFGFGLDGQGQTWIKNYRATGDNANYTYDKWSAHVKLSADSYNAISKHSDGLWAEQYRISSNVNNRLQKLNDNTYFVQDINLSSNRKNGLRWTDGTTRGTLWCREVLDYREVTQADHGFAVCDYIYYDCLDQQYKKAKAVDDYDINTVGMVTYVNGDKFEYMWSGFFETDVFTTANGYVQGAPLYLSDTTAGAVTQKQPDISKSVGYPVEDHGIIINLERGIQYNNEANIGDIKRSTNTYNVRTDGFIRIAAGNQYKLSLVQRLVDNGNAEFNANYLVVDNERQIVTFKDVDALRASMGVDPGIELFIKAF